ncbi:GNAT family N-acetyltransferase [Haloferax sp. MBLA0076]|uniref:GNAT family N-acetyltransferase n=1 Tax=Haloferax litoreum TaxID=2666140 RepID=A0A6A8GHA1_9EURY|nr:MULTISPECIES: GNAT family N-acetyltransferase [Haloferax]KAB1194010.1 GNAT family N-acetyltransferase [Haloferax sp. CBA1148]MRX22558.1 GNAT family N-acetyltransferase [Haloferax litoreum]
MTETEVRVVSTDDEREDAFAVRKAVFVDEQGVDEEIEWDEYDEPESDAVHFVGYRGGEAVGAARLREYEPGVGKVERVAVLESARGEGWGRRLMETLESEARSRGFDTLVLHGQTSAEGFYHGLNYETTSDVFDEAGIPHVEMEKNL